MIPVTQYLVPNDKYGIKCPYEMTPEGLCIHNTANDAPAINEVKYMISNNKKVSFHWAIDDKSIIQCIPENRNAFHAGDGAKGRGNRKTLSIEICYSKSGGKKFIAAEKNAAEFAAFILKKYGWGIDKLSKHQDYSGKYCPHRTLDMGWDRFVKMVEEHLNKSMFEDLPTTHWGYTYALDLFKRGIVKGTGTNSYKMSPGANVTRAEAAVMIYRTINSIVNTIKPIDRPEYMDVNSTHWAYNEIEIIKNIGIIDSYNTNKFRPSDPATRAEIAVMIRNAINFINAYSVEYKKDSFTDVPESHWAYKHIHDLHNMGIITGYSNNTYMPSKSISRIETMVIISRMLSFLGK